MPGMPRFSKRAIKIAYKIMGVPANIRAAEENKKKKQTNIDRRLTFEATSRVR